MGVFSGNDVDAAGSAEVTLYTAAGVELVGQQVSAASLPVVIASNQSAISISAASLPLPTGAATAALQTTGNSTLTTIDTDLGIINANLTNGNQVVKGMPAAVGQTTMAASLPVVIASNQTSVPVTVTIVTPKTFSASMNKTGIGTTELNTLFLKNPNASGKTLIIKEIIVTNDHTVANSWIRWRVYSNPTTSANGSAITVGAMNVGAGNTAVATPFNTPTSSANGNMLLDLTVIAGTSILEDYSRGFTVAANNTVMITAIADATTRVGSVTVIWEEE